MIRFKVKDKFYAFQGKIEVRFKKLHLFEKKNPFRAGHSFTHGEYYRDTLVVSIVATPEQYQRLYFDILNTDKYNIGWQILGNFQIREIEDKLPSYPSLIRYLNDAVEFTIETTPYFEIIENMCPLENNLLNKAFGHHRIVDTVFGGVCC